MDYCTHCGDGFDPVEYNPSPADPDEPRFCSDDCDRAYWEAVDFREAYDSAGDPATVF